MKILKGTGRFGCAVVSLAALAVLLSGCGAAPDTSGEISLSPDISRASGNGYTYYLIEDGTLMAWGESYSTTDYDQRQPIFHGAQSVWTRRFGTLVLDQEGDLWTSDSMGLEGAREQEGMWYVLSDVVCATGSVWNSAAVCADGSLWTWGRNASGELSNGEIAEDAFPLPPQHIMDGVRSVRAGTYAITIDGALYRFGEGCLRPQHVMDGVADAARAKGEEIQVLTPEGELFLLSDPADRSQNPALSDAPAATLVRRVFDGGYQLEDSAYWIWAPGETEPIPLERDVELVVQNMDEFMVIPADGEPEFIRIEGREVKYRQ